MEKTWTPTPAMVIALVIVFVFLLIGSYFKTQLRDGMLEGMWKADEDFLQKAELSGFYFYVGPSLGSSLGSFFSEKRRAYILMHSEETVIINRAVNLYISGGWLDSLNPFMTASFIRSVQIEPEDSETQDVTDVVIKIEDVLPRNMTMEISMLDGRMVLSGVLSPDSDNEPKVYADLFKDTIATANAVSF